MKLINRFKPFIIFTKKLHLEKILNMSLQKQKSWPMAKIVATNADENGFVRSVSSFNMF